MVLVCCLFLNTFITGESIDTNTSARDILIESGNLSDPIGAAGYWGIIGIFFPIFLSNIKSIINKYIRFIYIIILIYLVYKLLFAGFTTAIGLLVLNIIIIAAFYSFYHAKSFTQFFGALILMALIIFGINYFLNWILTSDLPGLRDVQWRLLNIIEDPTSGGYTSHYVSRYDLFFVSAETFLRFPLFGSGADIMTMAHVPLEIRCGGHSSLFDGLAILGLFGGGGAMVFFFFKSLKNANSKLILRRSFEDMCHTSVVSTLIIGGVLNPYWMGSIFIIFLLITHIYKIPIEN
jgi:hypothetical protein